MADESPRATNPDQAGGSPLASKQLLLVAIILAAIVAVIYNVRITQIQSASKGETVELIRVVRDMQAGEKIRPKDVETVEVSAEFVKGLDNYMKADEMDTALTSTLYQPVLKGRWLKYEHTVSTARPNPSQRIRPGMVTYTLAIDPRQGPGEILSVGDRVSVLGMLVVGDKPLQAYRIIEDLKVIEIGGVTFSDRLARPGKRQKTGQRQYRKITVEVTADVSLQLANVLSHVRGNVWLEVRNPTAGSRIKKPQINSKLRDLTASRTER